MSSQVKFIMLVLASQFLFSQSHAAGFPRGCEVVGFGYNNGILLLNDSGNQTYYLMQNRSPQTLQIQRIVNADDFMTPQLTARLDSNNWAAFSSDIANLPFECALIDGNTPVKVSCSEVLEICQYPRVKFALSNMGNYWVSVNHDQRQVINDSTAKGIYLRW